MLPIDTQLEVYIPRYGRTTAVYILNLVDLFRYCILGISFFSSEKGHRTMVPRHIDRKNIYTNFRALYLGTKLRIHVSKCFPEIYYSCINRNTLGYKEYLFFLGWIRNRTNIPINPSDHNYIHTNILFIILFTHIVYNFAAHRFDLICTKFSRFCTNK